MDLFLHVVDSQFPPCPDRMDYALHPMTPRPDRAPAQSGGTVSVPQGASSSSGQSGSVDSPPMTSSPTLTPAAGVRLGSIRPLPPLGESLRLVPFLCLCAMAGVLTRIGLGELFGSSVLGVTSGHSETFPDWFANAWGCLVMGLLVPMRQSRFFARYRYHIHETWPSVIKETGMWENGVLAHVPL